MQQHPFSRAREQGKTWRMMHRGSAQEGAKLGYGTCKVRIGWAGHGKQATAGPDAPASSAWPGAAPAGGCFRTRRCLLAMTSPFTGTSPPLQTSRLSAGSAQAGRHRLPATWRRSCGADGLANSRCRGVVPPHTRRLLSLHGCRMVGLVGRVQQAGGGQRCGGVWHAAAAQQCLGQHGSVAGVVVHNLLSIGLSGKGGKPGGWCVGSKADQSTASRHLFTAQAIPKPQDRAGHACKLHRQLATSARTCSSLYRMGWPASVDREPTQEF